jgi:hypothetical protein
MNGNFEATVAVARGELMEPWATLFAVQRCYGDKVREQTIEAYGRLLDARLLITGVLAAALLRIHGKIVPIDSTHEERKALSASFVIGIEVCENAIVEGRYLQALALLRQEMETVARIKTVRFAKTNGERRPNIAVLGNSSLARLYGELSEAAHVSHHQIVRTATQYEVPGDDLSVPTSRARYFPAFDQGLARRSLSLHLGLMLELVQEFMIDLEEQYREAVTEREVEAVNLAVQLMQAEGMVDVIKGAEFKRVGKA